MSLRPADLKLLDQQTLKIQWTDGQVRQYSVSELRGNCPCATCREKRTSEAEETNPLAILTPEEAKPLTITAMNPIGSYAYGIAYSDGHDTGIYTFEDLIALGEQVAE